MSEQVIVSLIVTIGSVVVALINRGGWRRCETKLDALAKHLGVKFDGGGKVISLVDPRVAYAEQKR